MDNRKTFYYPWRKQTEKKRSLKTEGDTLRDKYTTGRLGRVCSLTCWS